MIKIDVISGFLGAGKTTLIKKMLKAYEDEKVVLIENEFGEIGIDGDIVKRDGFEVLELTSGCICCSMKKDFVNTFTKIIEEYNPERVIIEPTGISILSEIIEILKGPKFADRFTINTIITVIDGVNYLQYRDAFGEFFEDQIKNAGTLIISKSQMIDDKILEDTVKSLKELNLKAPIITEDWCKLDNDDMKRLLELDLNVDFNNLFYAEYKPCGDNQFQTLGIRTIRKFTEKSLIEVLESLKKTDYGMVIRSKGFVKGANCDLEFSYVNGQYSICENKEESTGKLCIIGKDLKDKKIKELFNTKIGGLLKW